MGSIPLGRSAYERAQLPPITLKNYFYEQAPTNLEDQVAIIPRPRLKQFAVAGDSSLVPTMTSNSAPAGYVAAASSEYTLSPDFEAFRAFDGNTTGNFDARWMADYSTGTLQLDLPSPVTLTAYRIYNSAGNDDDENPADWTLEGWDGGAWVLLDTVTGETGWTGTGGFHDFTLAASADVSKLKWTFTANQGAPNITAQEIVLIGTDGDLGAGPITGLYRKGGVIGGAILAKKADQLFKVVQAGVPGVGTATLIGTVSGSGLRMTAEGNTGLVVLTAGTTLYSTNGTSLTTISFPDSRNAFAVDALNNYFLVASDEGRFYWSAIGGTTFDALDYAEAESQPDGLMTLKVVGDELWLFGRLSVEVWQPTGDLDLPFQRIGGRIFGIGITARDTCQKFNVGGLDTVCWVGTDRRVYRTNPNPVRISDNSIEEKLRRIEVSLDDNSVNPYATTCSWDGHDFYILHIPGEGSFAYDLSTGMWDEWTSHDHPFFRGAVSCVGPNAQPLFGDDTTSQLWELSLDAKTDGEDPVAFEFTGLLEVPGASMRCESVSLDVATGTATDLYADPVMQLSWSDELGVDGTFSDPRPAYLGREGERAKKVLWTRCGMLKRPGRVFRWVTSEPVVVRKAKFNEALR